MLKQHFSLKNCKPANRKCYLVGSWQTLTGEQHIFGCTGCCRAHAGSKGNTANATPDEKYVACACREG